MWLHKKPQLDGGGRTMPNIGVRELKIRASEMVIND